MGFDRDKARTELSLRLRWPITSRIEAVPRRLRTRLRALRVRRVRARSMVGLLRVFPALVDAMDRSLEEAPIIGTIGRTRSWKAQHRNCGKGQRRRGPRHQIARCARLFLCCDQHIVVMRSRFGRRFRLYIFGRMPPTHPITATPSHNPDSNPHNQPRFFDFAGLISESLPDSLRARSGRRKYTRSRPTRRKHGGCEAAGRH